MGAAGHVRPAKPFNGHNDLRRPGKLRACRDVLVSVDGAFVAGREGCLAVTRGLPGRYGKTDAPTPTRLSGIGTAGRTLVAVLLVGLIAYGLLAGAKAPLRGGDGRERGDAALYRAIEGRVANGENYYRAAAVEQRRRRYPLRPFPAVRPPTLAVLAALSGGPAVMIVVLRLLSLLAGGAFLWRVAGEGESALVLGSVGLLLAATLTGFAQPQLIWWHEWWAGLLVMLALAGWRPGRWWFSLGIALLAAMVRELAFPFIVVMALMALAERRRREALAWGLAGVGALALLAAHALAVSAVVSPADPASPGWAAAGGWRFLLGAARDGTLLVLLPVPVAAVLVPLALFGWASRRGPWSLRVAGLLGVWVVAFLLIGRPDNGYWGLLLGPLLTPGLAFAIPALRDLVRPARPAGQRGRFVLRKDYGSVHSS